MRQRIVVALGILFVCMIYGCKPAPPIETHLYSTIDPSTAIWLNARPTPTPAPTPTPQLQITTIKTVLTERYPTLKQAVHRAIILQQEYYRLKEQGATPANLEEIQEELDVLNTYFRTLPHPKPSTKWIPSVYIWMCGTSTCSSITSTSTPKPSTSAAPQPATIPQSTDVTPSTASGSNNCQGCCSSHGGVVCRNGVTQCSDGSPLSGTCRGKGCNMCM